MHTEKLNSNSIQLKSLNEDGKQIFVIHSDKSRLIGRDDLCDLIIDNAKLSKKHARIFHTDKGFIIEDLSSTNGTFVNDNKIDTGHLLHAGDIIRFSEDTELCYIVETKQHTPYSYNLDTIGYATLTLITNAGNTSNQYVLPMDKSMFAGRSRRVKICLDDRAISAVHCKFTGENNKWLIRPMGEKSKVYVNDEIIKDISTLHENDKIKIGKFNILFNIKNTAVAMPSINIGPDKNEELDKMIKTGDWAIKALNLDDEYEDSQININYTRLVKECEDKLKTVADQRLKKWYEQRLVFLKDAKDSLQKNIQQSRTLLMDGSQPSPIDMPEASPKNSANNTAKKHTSIQKCGASCIKIILILFVLWLLWEILLADSFKKSNAREYVKKGLASVSEYEKQGNLKKAVEEIDKIDFKLLKDYPELKRQVKNKKYQLNIKTEIK